MSSPTLIPIKCGCHKGWMHKMKKRNKICPRCYGGGWYSGKPGIFDKLRYNRAKIRAGVDRLIEDKFKGVKHG